MLYKELGIMLRFVSRGRPVANRQVEKVYREIKRSVQRYALLNPKTNWFDWLAEIMVGLSMVM